LEADLAAIHHAKGMQDILPEDHCHCDMVVATAVALVHVYRFHHTAILGGEQKRFSFDNFNGWLIE